MRKYLFIIFLIILISCNKTESTKGKHVENSTLPKKENRIVESVSEKNPAIENIENSKCPKQSKIIKS